MGKRTGLVYLRLPLAALVAAGCAVSTEEPSDNADTSTQGSVTAAGEGGLAAQKLGEKLESVDRVLNDYERSRMTDWVAQNRVADAVIKKRLRTADGRNVNCVDVNEQPSVRRLKLGQVDAPPVLPDENRVTVDQPARALPLLDNRNGAAACDAGTVPVTEITQDVLARFRSLDDFFKKIPSHLAGEPATNLAPSRQLSLEEPHDGPADQHQYAVYSKTVANWGSWGGFNVWKPATELTSEFSLLQTWVVAGTGAQKQTLESGWQVYRDLYSNAEPHLFIYSTRDGYGSTGCYNNSCSDFVQVSSTVFPGAALSPVSTAGAANQKAIDIQWVKGGDSGHWWLKVGTEWVGYYPRSLFNAATGVANHAASFRFGGEIIDNENGGHHTTTDMGSGSFPSGGFGTAAYLRNLRYYSSVNASGTVLWSDANTLTRYSVTDALCYDASYTTGDASWGSYLFLGGPGYHSTNCQ